jgi:L-galactose dehydrogenase/L-glyceraldehyde 3-phosphate reductase
MHRAGVHIEEEHAMKYRRFGRTGIEVSEVVLGGGNVGGILIDADDATRREAVRRILAAGVNWIDTAAQYGNGKSEEALGWLLPECGSTPHLSTKIAVDVQSSVPLADQVEQRFAEGLSRLRRDAVDLLQLHNRIGTQVGGRTISVEHVLGRGGVLEGFERLRARGAIRHMGITAIGEAPALCEVIASGRVHSAQVYYNLLNPSAAKRMPPSWTGHDFSGVIDACRANGVAVMAIRVFAAGVIATDVRHGRESMLTANTTLAEEERKARAVFEAIGAGHGTRAQVALRFALSHPDVSCAIIGAAELHHIDEALAAQAMGPLPGEVLAKLDGMYRTDFGRT